MFVTEDAFQPGEDATFDSCPVPQAGRWVIGTFTYTGPDCMPDWTIDNEYHPVAFVVDETGSISSCQCDTDGDVCEVQLSSSRRPAPRGTWPPTLSPLLPRGWLTGTLEPNDLRPVLTCGNVREFFRTFDACKNSAVVYRRDFASSIGSHLGRPRAVSPRAELRRRSASCDDRVLIDQRPERVADLVPRTPSATRARRVGSFAATAGRRARS